MSTNDSNDWVKEGTPRDEWDADTDYGVEVEPGEWDDYSEEQAVPVPTPPAAKDYQPPAPEPEPTPEPEPEPEAAHEPAPEPEVETAASAAGAEDPEYEVGSTADDDHEPRFDAAEEPEPEPEFAVAPDADDEPQAATQEDPEPVRERPRPVDDPDATTQHAIVRDEPEPATQPEQGAEEDSDATRRHDVYRDEPVTDLQPEPVNDPDAGHRAGAAAAAAGPGAMGGLYRAEPDEADTRVIDQSPLEREQAREDERLAKLQEERDARDARLGIVPGSDTDNVRVVTKPAKRQSDKFFGAFALFVLRLITAAVIGVLGFQVLQDIDASEAFFATTVIPEPRLTAWILGSVLIVSAFLLVIGLGARVVGFVLLALSIASLVTIRWGAFSIFVSGMEGFYGDRTLLTAAVALVLLAFGAGAWSIDGAIRNAREESRAARGEA